MLSQCRKEDLEKLFTDVEHPRDVFATLLASPELSKRLLVIHGVGGIGKSWLLGMFWLHCKKDEKFPVALASGDHIKSSVKILEHWSEDLKADRVNLRRFAKTLARYQTLQAKIENRTRTSEYSHHEAWDAVGRTAVKTAGKVTAGVIPIPAVGTIAGALGEAGVEGLIQWLRHFLSKSDIDLICNPVERLTTDFLDDLAQVAVKQRCVLMLDVFEQINHLERWLCDLAQRLHPNVLLVIAGRAIPEGWNLEWPGWLAQAEILKLASMTPDVMRTLIHRYYKYYKHIRGGEPDSSQVEAIVRFARGLPIVLNSAVFLFAKHGMKDFKEIRSEVVSNLVDQFRIGLPKEIYPVLETAATVRWFNKEILRAVSGKDDVNAAYEQLQHLPIVRPGVEGLALHDVVREIMDENLRIHDPGRHRELHGRAALHFRGLQNRLKVVTGINEHWEQLALEEVFHLLQASEDKGMELLHTLFGRSLAYFRYQFCRELINDAKSLNIRKSRLEYRLKYYTCRLRAAELSYGHVDQEEMETLIAKSELDTEIQWEVFLTYASYLHFAAKHEEARDYVYRSLKLLQAAGREESSAGCMIRLHLAGTYSDPSTVREELLKQALHISRKIGEPLHKYSAYVELGHIYFTRQGYLKAREMWLKALKVARACRNDERIADALNRLAQSLIAMRELAEAERCLNAAMKAAKRLPDMLGGFRDKEMYINRHFGVLYYVRGEYDKAIERLFKSAETYRLRRSINGFLRTLVLLAECLYEAGYKDRLETVAVEVDGVVGRTSLRDFAARWFVLQGHMLLDKNLHGYPSAEETLGKYMESIKNALGSNANALDDTINRILWKLSTSGNEQEGKQITTLILKELIAFWNKGQVNNKSFSVIEHEKRKLANLTEPASFEPQILNRLEHALQQGVEANRPEFWRGL